MVKFVDSAGLKRFWQNAKNYIDRGAGDHQYVSVGAQNGWSKIMTITTNAWCKGIISFDVQSRYYGKSHFRIDLTGLEQSGEVSEGSISFWGDPQFGSYGGSYLGNLVDVKLMKTATNTWEVWFLARQHGSIQVINLQYERGFYDVKVEPTVTIAELPTKPIFTTDLTYAYNIGVFNLVNTVTTAEIDAILNQ